MKWIRVWCRILTYLVVIYGALMAVSCECDPKTLNCPEMNQEEFNWVKLHNQKMILFTDSIGHKVTFSFNIIDSHQDETDECKNHNGSCNCSCRSYVQLRGKTAGYYDELYIGIEISNRLNFDDVSAQSSFKFVFDSFQKSFYSPPPFFRHNESKLYPTKLIGKRTFSNVYELKLAEQKDTARSKVLIPETIYITETEGIVGFKNLLDSLVFYKQF